MNGIKYAEWASHYDPENLEIKFLHTHGINFLNSRVIEVGCGTGRFTKRIINDCKEIVCIDPDKKALDVLVSNIDDDKMQIVCGTLESVCLEKKYYDYVVFPWSMYLIPNQKEVLELSKEYLKHHGKIIILQAKSGEYEEEVATLYRSYNPLKDYEKTYDTIEKKVRKVFGEAKTDTLKTYFVFDTIDQVIDCSLFFIQDEEGKSPRQSDIMKLRRRLEKYIRSNGSIIMSDIVSVTIATKRGDN